MWIEKLPDEQRVALLQCMQAIAESQLIEDWEMQTRLGVTRVGVSAIVARWPNVDDSMNDSPEFLAINNCMNEICHGVSISDDEWGKWFTITRPQVLNSYRNWLRLQGRDSSGLR